MAKSSTADQHSLFTVIDGGQSEPLTLVSADPVKNITQVGRPDVEMDAQTPKPESQTPSRTKRERVHLRLPIQTLRKAKVFAAVNNEDLQDIAAEGMEMYMAARLSRAGILGANVPTINAFQLTDDDDTKKQPASSDHEGGRVDAPNRESGLLKFYSEATGNKVKEADRAAFREVEKLSDVAIRSGVLKSVILCATRVNSFRYCVGAIKEIEEAGIGPEYVDYLASKLRALRIERASQRGLRGARGKIVEGEF